MGNVLVDENILQGWADVVREKQGIEDKMKPSVLLEKTREMGGSDNTLLDAIITRTITDITSELTEIGDYAFCNCTSLTSASFPNATEIGSYVFNSCTNLTEVSLPNVGGSISNAVGGRAFQSCTSLKSISLPKYRGNTSAAGYIYSYCTNLENVDLPIFENMGGLRMFYRCSSLTNLKFPVLHNIGSTYQFADCVNLTTLILPYETAVVTLSSTDSFINTPIESGTGYIYVPQALIEEYKVATNWSIFADQFRAIEDYPEICGGDA